MDSRDILIIGAVAVAAFLYFRSQPTTVSLPAGAAGPGVGAMTTSAAATTGPAGPSMTSQVGAPLASGFRGFSALNMGQSRFNLATAVSVITDNIPPPAVTRPPVQSTPTVVGGAGVFGVGANTMGPQPMLTHIFNPGMRY